MVYVCRVELIGMYQRTCPLYRMKSLLPSNQCFLKPYQLHMSHTAHPPRPRPLSQYLIGTLVNRRAKVGGGKCV